MLIKIFLILFSIVFLIVLALNYVKNKIRKAMFGNIDPKNNPNFQNFSQFNQQKQKKDEEVVYSKDNTVILKGEAKSKKDK